MAFSGALKLTDLDDFITPSQECIKPVEIKKTHETSEIKWDDDGNAFQVSIDGTEQKLEKATISLNDCLACSGCITSAESVLISMQSHEEVFKVLAAGEKTVVISISPQSRASIAVKYGLTSDQVARKLAWFFKSLGCHFVFDASFGRAFSLLETAKEFVERFKSNANMPLLTSACPGWICYAEKKHGNLLPLISTTKSPQQVMGSLVKDYLAGRIGKKPNEIYHVAIMPCFDKKLEASRSDFYNDVFRTRDVDCVISTGELDAVFEERSLDFCNAHEELLDSFTNGESVASAPGDHGSGGYLEHTLSYAARELFGLDINLQNTSQVAVRTVRNADFKEYIVEENGKELLRFASAYGFKNIQNVVRKLKTKQLKYHFVEIMACPSGCVNGGGQIRPSDPTLNKLLVNQVLSAYQSFTSFQPQIDSVVTQLYRDWITQENRMYLLHTHYHSIESTKSGGLSVKW